MSLGPEASEIRKSSIDSLRFKRTHKGLPGSSLPSAASSTSSLGMDKMGLHTPPVQSRDATQPLPYLPPPPRSPGKVLVPSSSPLLEASKLFDAPVPVQHASKAIPNIVHASHSSSSTSKYDPLSASSGFTTGQMPVYASTTRPWSSSDSGPSSNGIHRGEPPRKRMNRGDSPDGFVPSAPSSPEVARIGQRRRPNAAVVMSSASEDESIPGPSNGQSGSSRPRIVRPHASSSGSLSSLEPARPDDEQRFTKFKMTHPIHSPNIIRAAWNLASGDEAKASAFLNDPSWRPPVSKPPSKQPSVASPPKPNPETGRVKEVEDATKAERARVKQLGRKSMIYNRPGQNGAPESQSQTQTSPSPPKPITFKYYAPPAQTAVPAAAVPDSPEVVQRPKRLKRKIVQSDSEDDYAGSDDEVDSRSDDGTNRIQALSFFNDAASDSLQEVTGCTPDQAGAIIKLRPFKDIDDLNAKLGQNRKKAGPAGISSRLFEDCATIFEGYGKVDSILEKCERVGEVLRTEISTWTTANSKLKGRESTRASPTSDVMEEGALSIRSAASLASTKPDYYICVQPRYLSKDLQLKEYQMLGINWLNLLYMRKYSCILADEMGLGKTVQVISFLAHLKEKGNRGPHLVVVPSSTLENWLREFERFAPELRVRAYYAGKEERAALRQELRDTQAKKGVADGWEVLVTTYNLAQGDDMDRKFFRHVNWDSCVYDEGHVLKNFQSQRYQALMRYESKWRLLLTGTPLQNNLQELVSLMHFIWPSQFGKNMDSLRAVFKAKGDSKVTLLAQERVSRAKKMLTPFVLRRRKDQVLQDLPKKSERIEWCEMTKSQLSIYNEALQRSRKTIFDMEAAQAAEAAELAAASTNGKGKQPKKKTKANARAKDKMYLENSSNVLMDLRKAALHPMLFRRLYTDEAVSSIAKVLMKEPDFKKRGAVLQYVKEDMEVMTDSELQAYCALYKSTRKFLQEDDCYLEAGKIQVLLKLMDEYQKDERRILIFSQFTQVLDILKKVLDVRKVKYLTLTGATPVDARQSLVDEFTEDESIPVFLLSTRAGGMGINLTAASVVIMFDQDFNPHNDKQAQDRAYRIGQKRDVEVVKLITKDTIEEDILSLGMTKLALDEAVAGEEVEEKVEREMKTSLMSVVRKKLEGVGDSSSSSSTTTPAASTTIPAAVAASNENPNIDDRKEVAMDVDDS
ncbi:SNF2 family N-terminal domain-containing protein [Abortiporus biennis]|nr:SNF2 family N-terminal domain-containing protein [Abortiporus biennis]